MATECYAMVRGSGIRVTGLDDRGRVTSPVRYATSKAVTKVTINEVVESASNEMMRTADDERRLRLVREAKTIRYTVDIEFLRVDPGVLSLITGVPLVYGASGPMGFGEGGFGEIGFGEGTLGDPFGKVAGFDSDTRPRVTSFGLEVWTKLAGRPCEGARQYGYTLFPYLRGGRLSGFTFANGLVSFNILGAQTRRLPQWGVGPYDLGGRRLVTSVSRNTSWRTFITSAAPPEQMNGIQQLADVIDNGTPDNPMPDPNAPLVLSGGGATTSSDIVSGGRP